MLCCLSEWTSPVKVNVHSPQWRVKFRMGVKQRTKSIIPSGKKKENGTRRRTPLQTKCRHITNSPVVYLRRWTTHGVGELWSLYWNPCCLSSSSLWREWSRHKNNNKDTASAEQLHRSVAVNPNSSSSPATRAPPAKRRNHPRVDMCVRCSDLFSIHIRDHIIYKTQDKTREAACFPVQSEMP